MSAPEGGRTRRRDPERPWGAISRPIQAACATVRGEEDEEPSRRPLADVAVVILTEGAFAAATVCPSLIHLPMTMSNPVREQTCLWEAGTKIYLPGIGYVDNTLAPLNARRGSKPCRVTANILSSAGLAFPVPRRGATMVEVSPDRPSGRAMGERVRERLSCGRGRWFACAIWVVVIRWQLWVTANGGFGKRTGRR